LSTPVNLAAGGSDYPFWRFLAFNVAGSLTRILLVGGLGYLFGSQWGLANEFISRYMVLMGVALVLGAGVYFVMRRYRLTIRMA
jgi:membrane protein DedA with SNARE-associated domain